MLFKSQAYDNYLEQQYKYSNLQYKSTPTQLLRANNLSLQSEKVSFRDNVFEVDKLDKIQSNGKQADNRQVIIDLTHYLLDKILQKNKGYVINYSEEFKSTLLSEKIFWMHRSFYLKEFEEIQLQQVATYVVKEQGLKRDEFETCIQLLKSVADSLSLRYSSVKGIDFPSQ